MAKLVTIYPVPGAWLPGVAAVPHALPADEAERLVATGAFTPDPPPGDDPAQPEGPADAGPSELDE